MKRSGAGVPARSRASASLNVASEPCAPAGYFSRKRARGVPSQEQLFGGKGRILERRCAARKHLLEVTREEGGAQCVKVMVGRKQRVLCGQPIEVLYRLRVVSILLERERVEKFD